MLEVGGGRGGADRAARRRGGARARDRARPAAARARWRRSRPSTPNVELALGRRDAARPRGARPGADRGWSPTCPTRSRRRCSCGRSPSCRRLRSLDGDGPARDRRPAAGRARHPHLRRAERARPARLRGAAAAHGRPGRVHAAAAGRLGAARPAPDRPGAVAAESRGWSATPSPTGASRWRARSSTRGRARASRPARRSSGSACRRTPGPRASRRRSSPRSRRRSRVMRRDPARAGEAQPLPLPRAAARRRPARALLAVRAARARRPDRGRRDGRRARRGRLPRGRGPEPGGGRARGAARARLGARRRCGSRSRSGSRSRPGSAAAAPTPRRSCGSPAARSTELDASSPPGSAPTCPRSSTRRFALVAGAGERVEPLPDPGRVRRRAARPTTDGLRTAEVYAEADRLGARPRARRSSRSSRARLRAAAGAGASPLAYARAARQRPRAGGALAAPGDRRGARGARRGRAPRAPWSTGSGPTAVGLFADLAAADAAASALPPRYARAIVSAPQRLG